MSAIYGCSAFAAENPESSIVLPIEFDAGGLVADAERELPRRLQSEWEAVGKTVKMPVAYRFELERSPIELEGRGDRVLISTSVRYKVDVAVPGPSSQTVVAWRRVNGCQPRKPVILSLETRIDFTPDWLLRARSQPKLEMPEPCRLSAARELVQVDISAKVLAAFRDGLSKVARDFDRRLAGQTLLRDVAARAWASLAEPVPLGERTWLLLHPSRVQVMSPLAAGRLIRTGVIVVGQPELVGALAEAPSLPLPALPPLELTAAREGFALDWLTTLTWPELALRLREVLVGEQIKVAGRRTVRIEDVQLAPAGEQVLVTADLSGGIRGRIQLTGQPRFDAVARVVEFADLDFTLDTKSFLVRVADWFRHDATRRKLSALARLDLTKSLELARARIETALREKFGEELQLAGVLEIGEPFALAFDADSVRLNARLSGSLTLRWQSR